MTRGCAPNAWKKGRLSRGGVPIAGGKGRLTRGGAPIAWKKGELLRNSAPTAWKKGVPTRGVELALREKGGRNGALSMEAFCVEAGASPRDR